MHKILLMILTVANVLLILFHVTDLVTANWKWFVVMNLVVLFLFCAFIGFVVFVEGIRNAYKEHKRNAVN